MRIIYLLTLISLLCLVSAKYLPDESTSRALLHNKRSSVDESGDTVENQSNESNDDDDDEDDDSLELKNQEDTEKLHKKYAEQERKLQEKREKEERKIEEQLEKQRKKQQKLEAKFEEEQRKLQEKLEKEKRKQEEKLAKEERKRAEKIAKEERKAQIKNKKQLEELEKKTLESENKSVDSSESGEDLDFEDIWKNYVYQKYGLTENSTDLDKDAAVNRYLQEEIGLNANSTKTEYRQAVLQLVQSKLVGNSTTQNDFKNYFVNQINALYVQKLQADITNKIAELDNDTALLQNVSLPWTPEAKQAIGEEKSILTAIAQFLSDVVPTWISGGKPSNSSTSPSSITNNDVSGIASSNTSFVSNNNEGSSSTSSSESTNVQPVNVGDNVGGIESSSSSNPSIAVIPSDPNASASADGDSLNANSATSVVSVITTDAGNLQVDSNIDIPTDSTNTNLNENSSINQSAGSQSIENSNGAAAPGTTSVAGPTIAEGSIDLLPTNTADNNNPSVDATLNNSQGIGSEPSEISNGIETSSVSSPTSSDSLNTNSATSVVSVITSDAGNLQVDSNIDIPTDSTNTNLNENSSINQSAGSQSIENSNGAAAPGTTSVAGPSIAEGSIDLLPTNTADNNNPSVDATLNNSQGIGSEPSEISNGIETSSVSSPTSSDASTNSSLTISTDPQSTGTDILSSVSPSAESSTSTNYVSTGSEATTGSVTSEADVNTQVLNDNTSSANVGTQVVIENIVGNNPTGSEASENTAAASTSISDVIENVPSAETVSSVISPPAPGSLDVSVVDQSNGVKIPETVSIDLTSVIPTIHDATSINSDVSVTPVIDTTSTGEQIAAPVLPNTDSSINAASDAISSNPDVSATSQDTASTGSEITAENTVISSDVNKPLNIATSSSSSPAGAGFPELKPAEGTSSDVSVAGSFDTSTSIAVTSITTSNNAETPVLSAPAGTETVTAADATSNTISETVTAADATSNTISINPASDPISSVAVESTGITTAIPDVTGLNNIDTLVDTTSSDFGTTGFSDSTNVVSASSSDTISADTSIGISASNGNTIVEETTTNVVSASPVIPANSNTVITSGTEESITNALDVIFTTAEVPVALENDTVTSIQETAAEEPTVAAEVTNNVTSNSIDTTSANSEGTTAVNDSILVSDVVITSENVSHGPSEVVADTTLPVQTPDAPAGTEVLGASTIVSEPSNNGASVVTEELPAAITDTVPIDVVTNTVPSANAITGSNTVEVATADLSEPVPTVVETSAVSPDVIKPSLEPIEVTTTVSDANVISASSDGSAVSSSNVDVLPATSINDVPLSSNDITLVPAPEALGTDSSLPTTEAPQVVQNTPAIPQEIGASLLEVTQQ